MVRTGTEIKPKEILSPDLFPALLNPDTILGCRAPRNPSTHSRPATTTSEIPQPHKPRLSSQGMPPLSSASRAVRNGSAGSVPGLPPPSHISLNHVLGRATAAHKTGKTPPRLETLCGGSHQRTPPDMSRSGKAHIKGLQVEPQCRKRSKNGEGTPNRYCKPSTKPCDEVELPRLPLPSFRIINMGSLERILGRPTQPMGELDDQADRKQNSHIVRGPLRNSCHEHTY